MTERSDQAREAASEPSFSMEAFLNSSLNRMEAQERHLNDTGRAVQALMAQVSELTSKSNFCKDPLRREAARTLADLRQGERSVSDYSIEFRTLAAECWWNEEVQWDMFLHGLADRVQKEIYALDLPTTLNDLIGLALRVDARLSRVAQRSGPSRIPGGGEDRRFSGRDTVSSGYNHETMQVGRAWISREVRWRSQGLCLYCGAAGHYAYNCPVKDKARQEV
uniref:CCHC-type domain-containing protein n=1 Tax=Gasterosteus aculeatus aculeatus TaxID=481459 RepID=A0AAQ4PJR7_GASAC